MTGLFNWFADFKNRKAYIAEFEAWRLSAYPYDRLLKCRRCVTDHAVRGCREPKHREFSLLGHERGIGLETSLVCGQERGLVAFLRRASLGKFLLQHPQEILGMRQVYGHLYGDPETTAIEQVSVAKVGGRK